MKKDHDNRQSESAIVVNLATVQEEETAWLWKDRIPMGSVTLLIGDPGLGKSLVSLDIASRLTRGECFPGDDTAVTPGGVVLLGSEDNLSRTVVKRLKAANADMSRINQLAGIRIDNADPPRKRFIDVVHDTERIKETIQQTPDCRLLIVDPISGFLGKTDSHKNADVRAALAPLADLAEGCNVAIFAINHLAKKNEGPAMHRSMGSVGFMAMARAAWGVTADPEDRGRRLFVGVKNNLGPPGTSLAFRVREINEVPFVEWETNPVNISADEAFSHCYSVGANTARDDAKSFLTETLTGGAMPSAEIVEAAKEYGIAEKTLRRAFKAIGGKSRKDGMEGGWIWSLDPEDGQASE